MLQWTEKFETGHPLIDAQHQMLISYINRLESLGQSTNPTRGEVELYLRFIDFLETYAATHFHEEEDCMFRHRCAAHQDNKRAHAEFLDFYQGFKRRLAAEGCRLEGIRDLHESCVAWIQNHILRIDVQLRACGPKAAVPEP